MAMSSFVDKIMAKEGGVIRLITAQEQGRACWYYLRLSPQTYKDYQRQLKTDKIDVVDFGEIIESGWGERPPEDVIVRMKRDFDCDTPVY